MLQEPQNALLEQFLDQKYSIKDQHVTLREVKTRADALRDEYEADYVMNRTTRSDLRKRGHDLLLRNVVQVVVFQADPTIIGNETIKAPELAPVVQEIVQSKLNSQQ